MFLSLGGSNWYEKSVYFKTLHGATLVVAGIGCRVHFIQMHESMKDKEWGTSEGSKNDADDE